MHVIRSRFVLILLLIGWGIDGFMNQWHSALRQNQCNARLLHLRLLCCGGSALLTRFFLQYFQRANNLVCKYGYTFDYLDRELCFEGELLVDFLFCNSSFFLLPGLTLKGDEDGCGCVVKSVLRGGAVGLDGRIGVGDHLVAVNDESMIGLSGHRARCSSK